MQAGIIVALLRLVYCYEIIVRWTLFVHFALIDCGTKIIINKKEIELHVYDEIFIPWLDMGITIYYTEYQDVFPFSKSACCDIPPGMKSTEKETYHFLRLMAGKTK